MRARAVRSAAVALAAFATACFPQPWWGGALWCGDEICEWELDEGDTRTIHTWDEHEEGLALDATPTELSLTHTDAEDTTCYRFAATVNVEARTETRVTVDVHADGTVDDSFRLEQTGWKRVTRYVRVPANAERVRFSVRKESKGTVELALLRIEDRSHDPRCPESPLRLGPQNAGAACVEDDECRDDVCAGGYCSACAADGACERGESCGSDAHCADGFACGGATCSACSARGDCPLGSACREDDQCDSGVCARGLCSVCATDDDCRDGAECVPSVEGVDFETALVCVER